MWIKLKWRVLCFNLYNYFSKNFDFVNIPNSWFAPRPKNNFPILPILRKKTFSLNHYGQDEQNGKQNFGSNFYSFGDVGIDTRTTQCCRTLLGHYPVTCQKINFFFFKKYPLYIIIYWKIFYSKRFGLI